MTFKRNSRSRRSQRSRKGCRPGEIRRSGYVREYGSTVKREGYLVRRAGQTVRVYPKSRRVYVKSTCITDVGRKGKGVPPGSRKIGPLKKGELTKYGYHVTYPKYVRRDALKKAASAYGPLSLYRKLNAVAKLSATQAPRAAAVFAADREWVRHTYPIVKSLGPKA